MFQNYEGPSVADIAAVTRNNGYNNGMFGGADGGWWLLVLLFILGGNNGFGYGNNGFGGYGAVQQGFDQQTIMNSLNNLATSTSNGFANAEVSRCNQTTTLMQTMNANQMANLNSFNALGSAIQDVKYASAIENCQDRAAIAEGNQTILNTINSGVQKLLDDNCQRDIRAKDDLIAQLRTELTDARRDASQIGQTSELLRGFAQLLNNFNNGNCGCNSCCGN